MVIRVNRNMFSIHNPDVKSLMSLWLFKIKTEVAFKELWIEHRVSSAYHPQTNGLYERMNQTLKASIGKTIRGQQERWEDSLRENVYHTTSLGTGLDQVLPLLPNVWAGGTSVYGGMSFVFINLQISFSTKTKSKGKHLAYLCKIYLVFCTECTKVKMVLIV